MNCTCTVWELG